MAPEDRPVGDHRAPVAEALSGLLGLVLLIGRNPLGLHRHWLGDIDTKYYGWLTWRLAHLDAPTLHLAGVVHPAGLELGLLDGLAPITAGGLLVRLFGRYLGLNLVILGGIVANYLAARRLAGVMGARGAVRASCAAGFAAAPLLSSPASSFPSLLWAFTTPMLLAEVIPVARGDRRARILPITGLLAGAYCCSIYHLVFGGLAALIVALSWPDSAFRRGDAARRAVVAMLAALVVLAPFGVARLRYTAQERSAGASSGALIDDARTFSADVVDVAVLPAPLERGPRLAFGLPQRPLERYRLATIGWALLAGMALAWLGRRPPAEHGGYPARSDPAPSDPARSDPARSDPARSDPARSDPARSDSIRTARDLVDPSPQMGHTPGRDGAVVPLSLAAVALWVLSLGPGLVVAGHRPAGTHDWLPYRALLAVPGLSALRAPYRAAIPLAAVACALLAVGIARLRARVGGRVAVTSLATLVAVSWWPQLPTSTAEVPNGLRASFTAIGAMRQDAADPQAVMVVPFTCAFDDLDVMNWQVVHRHPMVTCGVTSAATRWYTRASSWFSTAGLAATRCDPSVDVLGDPSRFPADLRLDAGGIADLRTALDVRWVVFDRGRASGCATAEATLAALSGLPVIADDGRFVLFDLVAPVTPA